MVKLREMHADYRLFVVILLLLGFGLIILSSASSVVSFTKNGTNSYYFLKQLLGAGIGLVLMYITSKIDYRRWQKFVPIIILGTILILVLVLMPQFGFSVGGASRWISIGPIFFQPSEIAKLAIVIYLASWLDKRGSEIHDFYYGIIPMLIIVGVVAGLIILQPDIGTTLVIIGAALSMLFIGGSRIKHLAWIISAGLVAFAILVKIEPYRVARFTAFLNPEIDPQGIGYQINQAMLAIGSGGLFGYGYGASRQKYNYLPEVLGDSIFAIIVEELGFLRSGLFIGLFAYFVYRGIKIAKDAPDMFGRMLAVGIVAWISVQAIINIGAIIGILPLTGVPLPFVSYGSSALIVTLAAMGILLNISKHSTI